MARWPIPTTEKSAAYVERVNLTIRIAVRRFTRRTNAYSKSLDFHRYAMAIFVTWYNFRRPNEAIGVTPARYLGLRRGITSSEDIVTLYGG